MKAILSITMIILLSSCTSTLIKYDFKASPSLNESQYSNSASKQGVILLSVNWERKWSCGGFENAELRSLGFDLMPESYTSDTQAPDLVLNGFGSGSINYTFLLKPGTYAISYTSVKVAKSVNGVGYLTAHRSTLVEAGAPKGGTFDVKAGEVVYIGYFALDCTNKPMAWRYYIEEKNDFIEYIKGYETHYPSLNLGNVQYRLFKTKEFGHEFSLQ